MNTTLKTYAIWDRLPNGLSIIQRIVDGYLPLIRLARIGRATGANGSKPERLSPITYHSPQRLVTA